MKKVWSTFKIKNLGEYHDLYVQTDTLLLANVFENFREMCINTYQLDPCYFVSLPALVWQACLKKTKVKLELVMDYDMLLMFEVGIRGGICQSINKYSTDNSKYTKNYSKKATLSYLEYLDANNLYGWTMCKILPIYGFMWSKNPKIYTEDFIKSYSKDWDKGFLLEVDIEYPKALHKPHEGLDRMG